MTFLVIMFFFGLSAGTIGKIKGSSFFIWFLIGFALPAIGTFAALLYRFERNQLERQCTECGAMIKMADQVCFKCGADQTFPEEVYVPDGAFRPTP